MFRYAGCRPLVPDYNQQGINELPKCRNDAPITTKTVRAIYTSSER